jgi:hypothetical protein
MSDNPYALLDIEEPKTTGSTQTKQTPKTKATTQPTPLELAKQKQQKQQQQKKNPPPTTQTSSPKVKAVPPKDFDPTGFIKVESKRDRVAQKENLEKKKLNKEQFIEQQRKTGVVRQEGEKQSQESYQRKESGPRQTYPRKQQQQGGGRGQFKPKQNRMETSDVNDRNINRPDGNFAPNRNRYGEDKQPKNRQAGGKFEGGNSGYRKKTGQNNPPSRGRAFDKKSGSGLDPNPKKNEAGSENWGNPIDESLKAEEEAKKDVKDVEESSESSEYYVEPDTEGEEKKDNIVRKGFSHYEKKVEDDKQKVSELLEKHKVGVTKKTLEAPKLETQNINLNKKLSSGIEVDNERDAYFVKKAGSQTESVKPKTGEEQKDVKGAKQVAVTDVFKVKTKRHRGINTIEELERKGPKPTGSDRQTDRQSDRQTDRQSDRQTSSPKQREDTQKSQSDWDNKDRDRDQQDKGQRRDNYRGNNYRGQRDDQRNDQRNKPTNPNRSVGRGRYNILSNDDFPSLSNDNIEVSQPLWVNQNQ